MTYCSLGLSMETLCFGQYLLVFIQICKPLSHLYFWCIPGQSLNAVAIQANPISFSSFRSMWRHSDLRAPLIRRESSNSSGNTSFHKHLLLSIITARDLWRKWQDGMDSLENSNQLLLVCIVWQRPSNSVSRLGRGGCLMIESTTCIRDRWFGSYFARDNHDLMLFGRR